MVEHVNIGRYKVQEGDTPRSVAYLAYRNGDMYAQVLKANPYEWSTGDTVLVPNKKGRLTIVRAGEDFAAVIKRMFPTQPQHIYTERFYQWNGGESYEPLEGDEVFVPER